MPKRGRPKNNDANRVDVGPLREALRAEYAAGRITWSGLAKKMGWTRSTVAKWTTCDGEVRRYPIVEARAAKVMEVLGLTKQGNQTIRAQMGAELARIAGLDPTTLGLPGDAEPSYDATELARAVMEED